MTFIRFRQALFDSQSVFDRRLLIAHEGPLEVRYAPFDYINPNAKLVILGITPGEQQANAAILEAGRALRSGAQDTEAQIRAKAYASFSGPMRANLVAMLDMIGINEAFGISSCLSLWNREVGLVQFASALRYPVFNNGKNYSGSSPKMTASALLRDQLLTYTAVELASLQEALVLPLGPAVTNACHYLTQAGKLDSSRVIEGIPHPSGANGERIAYFLGRKEKSALSAKTDPTKIDAGRQAARKTVTNWRSKF